MIPRSPRRAAAPDADADGGPLTRELLTMKIVRLVDFMTRGAVLAFPRVSGLSDLQWRTLAVVDELAPRSMNELSELPHRDAGQVSRSVKALVAAGLLHRANRKGGPGVLITLTLQGRSVYRPVARLARDRNAAIIAGLRAGDIRVLERCVIAMTRNAIAELARERDLERASAGRKRRQRNSR